MHSGVWWSNSLCGFILTFHLNIECFCSESWNSLFKQDSRRPVLMRIWAMDLVWNECRRRGNYKRNALWWSRHRHIGFNTYRIWQEQNKRIEIYAKTLNANNRRLRKWAKKRTRAETMNKECETSIFAYIFSKIVKLLLGSRNAMTENVIVTATLTIYSHFSWFSLTSSILCVSAHFNVSFDKYKQYFLRHPFGTNFRLKIQQHLPLFFCPIRGAKKF